MDQTPQIVTTNFITLEPGALIEIVRQFQAGWERVKTKPM